MHPILLELGSLKIQAYGFFIALGYACALWLVRRLARERGLSAADFSDLCFLALVSGVIGARILFVLTNLEYFRAHPREIWEFWSGGLVFYGGFLLAASTCILFLRRKGIPLLRGLDVLAPALALGHAIGRWGCFAAGCCHGSYCPYPWGMRFDSDLVEADLRGLPLHPTQLYESFGLLALVGILLWLGKKNLRPGTVAAIYVLGYAALRFIVEFFRGDQVRGAYYGVSTSQWLALAILLFVGGGLCLGGRLGVGRFRRNH